jgi:hypothetical protein
MLIFLAGPCHESLLYHLPGTPSTLPSVSPISIRSRMSFDVSKQSRSDVGCRFVGYIEEEAVNTYTIIMDAIDKGALLEQPPRLLRSRLLRPTVDPHCSHPLRRRSQRRHPPTMQSSSPPSPHTRRPARQVADAAGPGNRHRLLAPQVPPPRPAPPSIPSS